MHQINIFVKNAKQNSNSNILGLTPRLRFWRKTEELKENVLSSFLTSSFCRMLIYFGQVRKPNFSMSEIKGLINSVHALIKSKY